MGSLTGILPPRLGSATRAAVQTREVAPAATESAEQVPETSQALVLFDSSAPVADYEPAPQAQSQTAAPTLPPSTALAVRPGLPQALQLAVLPDVGGAITALQTEVETFLSTNNIDDRAGANFRAQPPFVVRAVMDLGPLTSSSNPSASMMGRIKKAKEHIENVKREVALKVETFLAEEDGVDERAGAQLRMQDPDIQLVVMDRGTLQTSTNPSASLMGRIKKALEPGGNISRADIYSMKPGAARPVTPSPQAVQTPQVTQMRAGSAAMMNPAAPAPVQSAMAQNSMLPMMMAAGTFQDYGSAMMGTFGAMAPNAQFTGGSMGLAGMMGATPTAGVAAAYQPAAGGVAYQNLMGFAYPGATGQANMSNPANMATGLPMAGLFPQAAMYGATASQQSARPGPY